jgi:hypothetical protein
VVSRSVDRALPNVLYVLTFYVCICHGLAFANCGVLARVLASDADRQAWVAASQGVEVALIP